MKGGWGGFNSMILGWNDDSNSSVCSHWGLYKNCSSHFHSKAGYPKYRPIYMGFTYVPGLNIKTSYLVYWGGNLVPVGFYYCLCVFFLLLSYFWPIIVLFVTISACLMSLFHSYIAWWNYALTGPQNTTVNPLRPNIHIQILQTDLYIFP